MTRERLRMIVPAVLFFVTSLVGLSVSAEPLPEPASTAASATNSAAAEDNVVVPEDATGPGWMTKNIRLVALCVLGFGVLVLSAVLTLTLVMIKRVREGRDAGETGDLGLRYLVVTLVIVASVFLTVLGFEENKIAPALSLFGVIAGYLLGRGDRRQDSGGKSGDGQPDNGGKK